jgi:acetyl esterase/lipase
MTLVVRLFFLLIGLVALGFALILTVFIDVTGVRTIWALFARLAPVGLALSVLTIALSVFALLHRDPVGWAILGLGLGAGVMVLVQMPFMQAGRVAREWQASLDGAFGADWQRNIPSEVSQHFLPAPVNPGLQGLLPAQPLREQRMIYGVTPDGTELPLDVFRPDNDKVYPALISVHGGGWLEGGLGQGRPINRYLAGQGYVVVDMTYRFSHPDEGVFNLYPIPMADVRCAIGFVKDHADELGLDPERMALMGRSVGGHMALLSAYAPADLVEPTCATRSTYAVQAVIGLYSPTDLEVWVAHGGGNVTRMVGSFLGDLDASNVEALYSETSPLRYVSPTVPPTLLIDGARDIAVPAEQHDMLYAALQEAGVPSARLRIPWSPHGYDDRATALDSQATIWAIERFLAWRLYAQP